MVVAAVLLLFIALVLMGVSGYVIYRILKGSKQSHPEDKDIGSKCTSLTISKITQANRAMCKNPGKGYIQGFIVSDQDHHHAPCIEVTPSGLACAFFAGKDEGLDGTSIYVSYLDHGQDTWTTPIRVSYRSGFSNQNPVLWYNKSGNTLHLFHSSQPAAPKADGLMSYESRSVIYTAVASGPGYRTWGSPQQMWSEVKNISRAGSDNVGVLTKNRVVETGGKVILPIFSIRDGGRDDGSHDSNLLIRGSRDSSWSKVNIPNSSYLVQPAVIVVPNSGGKLRAWMRDRKKRNIYVTDGSADASTWSSPKPTSLPNNNSAVQAIVLRDNNVVIVYNPTNSDRYPISISMSNNGGQSWSWKRDLEGGSDCSSKCWICYPSVVQDDSGFIWVAYSYKRPEFGSTQTCIKVVRIDEQWIKGQ